MIEIQAPINQQFANWHQETVAEILARAVSEGKPEPLFSEDYSDDLSRKDYGSRTVKASDLPQDRVVGVYGTRKVRFDAPAGLEKGPRIITLKASAKKPIVCKGVLSVMMH